MTTSKAKIYIFFGKFFFHFSGFRPIRGCLRSKFFSKNVDFSLWGKQWIVLLKWTFFCILASLNCNFFCLQILAHCALHFQWSMIIFCYKSNPTYTTYTRQNYEWNKALLYKLSHYKLLNFKHSFWNIQERVLTQQEIYVLCTIT